MPNKVLKVLWLTISDRWFFPGTLAAVNSIRHYHPDAEIAVISSGAFNEALTIPQRELLTHDRIQVLDHQVFCREGRVLGAWQLKAYGACDLAGDYDVIVGIDSDAVLCGSLQDLIEASAADGMWRGGRDGEGAVYGDDYAPYGFTVPVRNKKYMSTSLYVVPVTELNRKILQNWALCCDSAVFGPQENRIYPGHGDQGVLNAVLFKHTRSENVVLLDNNLFSQHWVYLSDIIVLENGALVNKSADNRQMRGLHCGGSDKFWTETHSARLPVSGQNQTWSYAYWLKMLWFGPLTTWDIDPFQWLSESSHHLVRDLVYYYHHIEAFDASQIGDTWGKLPNVMLERMTEGIPRAMSIGGSMSQLIALAKQIPNHGVVVEVGSYFGGSAVTLAISSLHKSLSITCVESFMGNMDGSVDGRPLPAPKELLYNVKQRFPYLGVNVLHLESMHASQKFADESVDLVFVDGNHATHAVLADISAWLPKVKRGGILAGDDISWATVRRAVDEVFGAKYNEECDIWWVVKARSRV